MRIAETPVAEMAAAQQLECLPAVVILADNVADTLAQRVRDARQNREFRALAVELEAVDRPARIAPVEPERRDQVLDRIALDGPLVGMVLRPDRPGRIARHNHRSARRPAAPVRQYGIP